MLTPDHSQRDNHSGSDGPPASRTVLVATEEPVHRELSHVPVEAVTGTGLRILLIVILLAVALGAGFFVRHRINARAEMELSSDTLAAAEAPAPVDVVRVSTGSPVHELSLPGESRAWYQSTIYARVSGYVGSWHADIGDKVKKGEVLALIDTPELDDQLKAAEAKVAAEQSEVVVAAANRAFAESTYKRWKESPKGIVSEQETEQKKAEYLSSVAHLKAANSQVDLDLADVNRLTDLTNFKKVEAPYDGVITARRIDIGDLVTAGSTTGNTAMYDIAQSDKIRVYVDVPQTASTDVKDGAKATATMSDVPGLTFVGKVTRNSQSINEASKTLRVEVDIPNPDLVLKPGMYLVVNFTTTEARAPLRIPASALSFRTGGPEVAVVGKDGTVQFHSVTISQEMGSFVEIGSGLSAGDVVALNISNQIANGDKVQPVMQEEPAKGPQSSSGSALASKAG